MKLKTLVRYGLVMMLPLAAAAPAHAQRAYVFLSLDQNARTAAEPLRDRFAETLKRYGGRFVLRDQRPMALLGDAPASVTVVRFRTLARAQAWMNSADAKELGGTLQRSGKVGAFLVSRPK